MDLFEVINGRAFPSTHALLIEPFKSMWDNDTSEGRADSISNFTYIELLCSPKKSNPFFGYSEEIRSSRVKDEVFKDPEHELSYDTVMGVLKYKELLSIDSIGYELLCSSLNTADKLKNFLDDFDPNARTNSGSLLLKPGDITKALNDIPGVVRTLAVARDKVHMELEQMTKNRNNRETNHYEE